MEEFSKFEWEQVDAVPVGCQIPMTLLRVPSASGVAGVLQAYANVLSVVGRVQSPEGDELVRTYPKILRMSPTSICFADRNNEARAALVVWHDEQSCAVGFNLIFFQGSEALKYTLISCVVGNTFGILGPTHNGISFSGGYSPSDPSVVGQFDLMKFPALDRIASASTVN